MEGYNSNFLGNGFVVGLPDYSKYINDVAKNRVTSEDVLNYIYYSVIQSKSRRVPIVSASNIFRTKFEQVGRLGAFKTDKRIDASEQLTTNDYRLFNSLKAETIEKGHMTKREDVQWDLDNNYRDAQKAATSTFFYPNAVPQHDSLNNGPWKHLENSVIIKGRVPQPARVSVFTGPVLDTTDPVFKVKLDDGSIFRIPILFWKVIYYLKNDNNLYRAGFIMGQINPLRRDELIIEIGLRDVEFVERRSTLKPFLDFKEEENYQVSVSLIEELTKLKFTDAIDRHKDLKPTILKLQEVQIREFDNAFSISGNSYEVGNLIV